MANQALNQVPEVQESIINNVKCFLAVMNDGSIQQMSKELMAQVLEGLLPVADINNRGLMDKGIISKSLGRSGDENQQITIIKRVGSSYYSGFISVYKGGYEDIYVLSLVGGEHYIKKISGNDRGPNYEFYKNSNNDLIIKSVSTQSFRLKILLFDSLSIDYSQCMKDNSDTDLTKIDIQ